MSDALKFITVTQQSNFKFMFVENEAKKVLTDEDKKKLTSEAKKLAKYCCCDDEDYGCWITDKFSKFTKNTDAIFFVNARKKQKDLGKSVEFKDSYSVGIKVKTLTNNKFQVGDIKVPAMCETAAGQPIPLAWKSGSEDLSVSIGKNNGLKLFTELNAKKTRNIKLCFKDMLHAQLFLVSEIFVKYFSNSDFIVNSYINKQNYLLLERTGMVDLKLRYNASKPVLVRLDGVILELPVNCNYLKLPKASKNGVKNLVMYPEIENYYIENENLVGKKNCSSLRSISNIYEIAQRNSGFFYSCSSDYYISQFKASQGNITFSSDYQSLESLIQKHTTTGNNEFNDIIKNLFSDKKPFIITAQPKLFVSYTDSSNDIIEKITAEANKDQTINAEAETPDKNLLIKETTLKEFLKKSNEESNISKSLNSLKNIITNAEKTKLKAAAFFEEKTNIFKNITNTYKDVNRREASYKNIGKSEINTADAALTEAKSKESKNLGDADSNGNSRSDLIKIAETKKLEITKDKDEKKIIFKTETTAYNTYLSSSTILQGLLAAFNNNYIIDSSDFEKKLTEAQEEIKKPSHTLSDLENLIKDLTKLKTDLKTELSKIEINFKTGDTIINDMIDKIANSKEAIKNQRYRNELIIEFLEAATKANF